MPRLPASAEEKVQVGGVPTRFLVAGEGPAMVLLHGVGDNRMDWQWVLPALAAHHRVFAPDLPGFGGTGAPADCSPEFFQEFVQGFLDRLGLDTAVLVGSSLGGLVALRMALDAPDRVPALCLVDSAGLGHEVSPALRQLTAPGIGEATIGWGRTPLGAAQRAVFRVPLLFAAPVRVPRSWLVEQYRLSRLPGFLETTLAALRGVLDARAQRQVLLDDLPRLSVPTLLIWGDRDRVVPVGQARTAVERVPGGHLEVLAGTGHLPHVERPEWFAAAGSRFLARLGDGGDGTGARPRHDAPL